MTLRRKCSAVDHMRHYTLEIAYMRYFCPPRRLTSMVSQPLRYALARERGLVPRRGGMLSKTHPVKKLPALRETHGNEFQILQIVKSVHAILRSSERPCAVAQEGVFVRSRRRYGLLIVLVQEALTPTAIFAWRQGDRYLLTATPMLGEEITDQPKDFAFASGDRPAKCNSRVRQALPAVSVTKPTRGELSVPVR